MTDIFLSYARDDAATARRFAEAFQAEGLDVWWDYILQTGEVFDEAIEAALRSARAVVVLWSPSSVASRWVRAEATIADRRGTLLPATIVPCDRPIVFELTQTADLTGWNGQRDDPAWQLFLGHVRRYTEVRTVGDLAAAALPPAPQSGRTSRKEDCKPSVLILPFVNMSGDSQQDYFSDGVSEDIITDLGRIGSLAVVSRNTAFSLKGKTISAGDLAKRYGVSHILEGSVRRAGERVRITAQLFDAASDTQVWGERFDRTLDDIFAIQDEISKAIASALKIQLAPEESRALEQRDTSSSEAYELFLMARQFSHTGSERIKPLIVRLCKRAVEIDPTFGRAYALMAMAEGELAQMGIEGRTIDQARTWAERAMEVDPGGADGYAAMADVILRSGVDVIQTAQPMVDAALARDPDCYHAHVIDGYLRLFERNFEAAITSMERAIALDQQDYRAQGMILQAYEAAGDTASLRAASRRLLARSEEILRFEPDHGGALGFMVTAFVSLGDRERAIDLTRKAEIIDPDNVKLIYNLACAMALQGEIDRAIELLSTMIHKVDDGWINWMKVDSDIDALRDDPRFIALINRN